MNGTLKKSVVLLSAMLAMVAMTGCLQLELAIDMHDDGSATMTERLRFSKALLDLDDGSGLTRYLGRAGAQARMKDMGKGLTLKSHDEKKYPDGSRERVTVYNIGDIEDLRLPNPFVQRRPPAPMVRLRFNPVYKRVHSYQHVGDIHIHLVGAESKDGKEIENPVPVETPLDMQLYRDLHPIFADMMKDFEVKATLTVPNQPGAKGRKAGDRTIRLLHFNDKHKDRYSEPFLQNEEAMLSVLQFKMGDETITRHTGNFPRNSQLPVHRGRSPWASTRFIIRPTSHLYEKFYAGRPKSEGGDK